MNAHAHAPDAHAPHVLPLSVYLKTWGALLALTAAPKGLAPTTGLKEPPLFGEIGAALRIEHLPRVNDFSAQIMPDWRRHGPACWAFSFITLAFQTFFACWLIFGLDAAVPRWTLK